MSLVALSPGTVTLTLLDADQTQQMVLEVGVPGAAGSAGAAATITVGTTTTISAGSPATVNNSGTSSAAVFNFGIPQGTAGTAGATGATGATGPGVAVGGSTGQLLSKQSGASYDTTWTTVIPGDRYLTSSTTSNTVSNTNKTFTIGTGLSYTPTQNLTISFDASNHMHGEVLTYNSGTGVLTVDIKNHTGSGTYASWVVNVGGVTPATSVAWGGITGTLSSQTDLQTTLDLKANLTGTSAFSVVGSTIRSLDASDNFTQLNGNALQFGNLGTGVGGLTVYGTGITFPDLTTQSTAFPGFTGYAPLSAPSFTSGITVDATGITFSDSTTQTTAAVAPPSADVMTANAIAANIYSMGYGSSTWVGSGNPSVSGLIGWGIYNPTDGLIAYSYSTGSSFYLASSPTTLANSSVQVNGSNSSFYVA